MSAPLAKEKERLEAALGRLEAAVSQQARMAQAARESQAELQALREQRTQIAEELEAARADSQRLKENYDALEAAFEKYREEQEESGGADLRLAYEALREEHDKALNELDEVRNQHDIKQSEEGARMVRELAAARSAHGDLEKAYDSLKSEIHALKASQGGDGLEAETAKVDAALAEKRAELERLSSIRDEIAARLGRVIDQLESMTEGEN